MKSWTRPGNEAITVCVILYYMCSNVLTCMWRFTMVHSVRLQARVQVEQKFSTKHDTYMKINVLKIYLPCKYIQYHYLLHVECVKQATGRIDPDLPHKLLSTPRWPLCTEMFQTCMHPRTCAEGGSVSYGASMRRLHSSWQITQITEN